MRLFSSSAAVKATSRFRILNAAKAIKDLVTTAGIWVIFVGQNEKKGKEKGIIKRKVG